MIKFQSYNNPTSRCQDGSCCDYNWNSYCTPCDPYIEICIMTEQPYSTCKYSGKTRVHENTDEFVFESTIGGMPNPFSFSTEHGVSINITAKDDDGSLNPDIIGSASLSYTNITELCSVAGPIHRTLYSDTISVNVTLVFVCGSNPAITTADVSTNSQVTVTVTTVNAPSQNSTKPGQQISKEVTNLLAVVICLLVLLVIVAVIGSCVLRRSRRRRRNKENTGRLVNTMYNATDVCTTMERIPITSTKVTEDSFL